LIAAAAPQDAAPEAAKSAAFASHPGKRLYEENCAACHDGNVPRAPQQYVLRQMDPTAIISALTDGAMKQQGAALKPVERRQIAEYLTSTDLASLKPERGPVMCTGTARRFDLTKPPAPNGWGYDNRRFVPASVSGITAAELPRLKLKWAFAFPRAIQARSQPVIAMGAVFVGSQNGTVYAFDLASGCARWTHRVPAEVRSGIVVEPWAAGTRPSRPPRLYFGDLRGRVYALDAQTGRELWRSRPLDHPDATITATVVPHGDTLYVPISSLEVGSAMDPAYACCTFRGAVAALDSRMGTTRWIHYTVERLPSAVGKNAVGAEIFAPSGAPVWGSPTVDVRRGLLYHGSGENYSSPADGNSDSVFAVDLANGKRRWSYQLLAGDAWNNSCMIKGHPNCPAERGPDSDLAASVLLIDLGGRQALIAGAKSGVVTALDADTHELLWRTQVGRGSLQGGVHFGMAAEGKRIYVPIYDSKDQPLDGMVYDDAGYPGVHAIDATTGKILWRGQAGDQCRGRPSCDAGVSAAVTAIPGAVIAGYLDGWLRALDTETGKTIWQIDTAVPVKAVNGATARGGSMSGPGPALADGYMVLNSGYGFARKMPGNALLVYSLDGK
jgi:polyvinyl alcohol dehydrogenase (cytochrome)